MDVFDLSAKLKLDSKEYDDGLKDAEGKGQTFGDKLKIGLGNVLKVAGAASVAAIGAAAAGIVKITKDSIAAYADYEQLSGGIQKLYGNMGQSLEEYAANAGKSVDEVSAEWGRLEEAQNKVMENARNAYKTSGMDMNTYMDTATSFSASLINSLGGDTVKAAEMTDVAMRAISDNFNTFGGDIGMIQGAFQGFAKQNYTMLDNLKLGYAGTKTGMENLISDANEYAKSIGEAGDMSIDSFADIVRAVDLVQQKQKIAGTTQREAATTITGSLQMTKAAWQNLLIGLSGGTEDLDQMMNDLVDSAETTFNNILPVAEKALGGIASLIEKLAPVIAEKLPQLVKTVLPAVISAATSIFTGVAQALPVLLEIIVEQLPTIITAIVQAIVGLLPMLIQLGPVIINALWEAITASLPILVQAGQDIILSLTGGTELSLPMLITKIGMILSNVLNKIMEFFPQAIDKGIEFIENLGQGFLDDMPNIVNSISTILSRLITTLMNKGPDFLKKGIELIQRIISGFWQALPTIVKAIVDILGRLIITIVTNMPKFLQKGIELMGMLASGIVQATGQAVVSIGQSILNIIRSIKEKFTSMDWGSIGRNLINGIKNGIINAARGLANAAVDAAKSAWNAVTGWLKISSPSKKARDEIGKMWSKGIGIGFEQGMPVDEMVGSVANAFDEIENMDVPVLEPEAEFGYNTAMKVIDDDKKPEAPTSITINVYATERQDEKEIARQVQRQFIIWENQRRAAYA